uniref:Alginate lyase domain-containing protein n=1 Tax=Kwoniella pini CBS 10737 TaxID=1296096 RepID=A0A1B9HXA4_9TREE|nr:uncharacterized protein I206_05769 [Kwoniella pini CBS 10737]OCF47905.1 hypothetical protein I206_05769 [Kwoniella pini CBS 10737]
MSIQRSTKAPLPIPRQPLDILLPIPRRTSNAHTLNLLRQLVDEILDKDATYSITFSPILCPVPKAEGGGKNQLFTMKPHWWQLEDGSWENAKPQGQEQLQLMAKTVHTLSLGILYIENSIIRRKCIMKIEKLLKVFFIDIDTRMEPQIRFSQCHPGENPKQGNEHFVVAIRFLILVDQALILCDEYLDERLVAQVKDWIREQIIWMETSEQGIKAREKPLLWYHAIMASHYRLIDRTNEIYAKTSFDQWFKIHDTPEKTFADVMKNDNRRHRCLEDLQKLFIISDLTRIPGKKISTEIQTYLSDCSKYVKSVEKGPVEEPLEDNLRYFAKIVWFEKILNTWNNDNTGQIYEDEPDGKGWEGDWTTRMKILWGLI